MSESGFLRLKDVSRLRTGLKSSKSLHPENPDSDKCGNYLGMKRMKL
jgi:hypothetical protein